MLFQIRDYLCRLQIASNQQIAREFAIDIDALEPMLDCWLRKKVIAVYEAKSGCKKQCFSCKTGKIVYYKYLPENVHT